MQYPTTPSLNPIPARVAPQPWEDLASYISRLAMEMGYENPGWLLQPEGVVSSVQPFNLCLHLGEGGTLGGKRTHHPLQRLHIVNQPQRSARDGRTPPLFWRPCRGQRQRLAGLDAWGPQKDAVLEPLGEQAEPGPVPEHDLDEVGLGAAPEHEQVAGEQILPQHALHQHRHMAHAPLRLAPEQTVRLHR